MTIDRIVRLETQVEHLADETSLVREKLDKIVECTERNTTLIEMVCLATKEHKALVAAVQETALEQKAIDERSKFNTKIIYTLLMLIGGLTGANTAGVTKNLMKLLGAE